MRGNGVLLWLLRFSAVLGSLWIISQLIVCQEPAAVVNNNSLLEYRDDNFDLEKVSNCAAILEGNEEAVAQAKLLTAKPDFHSNIQTSNDFYIDATQDCREFRLHRKYLNLSLSKEEEDFPLAYSIVVHHKVQNFERLLRAIYAPQNIYCVHVDRKAAASVFFAIKSITSCFQNVFLVSKRVEVVYATFSRVHADLNCMADLYNATTKWKYFINLCGQDFPLKTNLEIVRALRALNGGNSLESEKMPSTKRWRVRWVHKIVDGKLQTTYWRKSPPPFNWPIFSGNAYIVVNRGYIQSVLEDDRIQSLMEWAKDAYSPDEFLWATIQRVPGVPGSKWPVIKHDTSDFNAVARLVKWETQEGSEDSPEASYPLCAGNHVRGVCVYGAGDVQWLLEQHHLFANKFDMYTDPIPVYCLEKYLREKALAELH